MYYIYIYIFSRHGSVTFENLPHVNWLAWKSRGGGGGGGTFPGADVEGHIMAIGFRVSGLGFRDHRGILSVIV